MSDRESRCLILVQAIIKDRIDKSLGILCTAHAIRQINIIDINLRDGIRCKSLAQNLVNSALGGGLY